MAARPNYILKPNIVLLMAGTNNIVKSKSESSAPIDLQRLLGDLLDEIPYVTVLVGTLPPLVRKDEWEERRLRYNRELQRVVNKLRDDGEKVEVADMYEVKKRMVLKDGIHINDHAYDIMAEAWVRAIEDAVEKRWISPLETEGTRGVDEVGRAWTVMKLGVIILLLAGLAGVARRGMFGAVARYKLVPQSASSSVRNFLQATGTWESE